MFKVLLMKACCADVVLFEGWISTSVRTLHLRFGIGDCLPEEAAVLGDDKRRNTSHQETNPDGAHLVACS